MTGSRPLSLVLSAAIGAAAAIGFTWATAEQEDHTLCKQNQSELLRLQEQFEEQQRELIE